MCRVYNNLVGIIIDCLRSLGKVAASLFSKESENYPCGDLCRCCNVSCGSQLGVYFDKVNNTYSVWKRKWKHAWNRDTSELDLFRQWCFKIVYVDLDICGPLLVVIYEHLWLISSYHFDNVHSCWSKGRICLVLSIGCSHIYNKMVQVQGPVFYKRLIRL